MQPLEQVRQFVVRRIGTPLLNYSLRPKSRYVVFILIGLLITASGCTPRYSPPTLEYDPENVKLLREDLRRLGE